jgi:CHAT domain-containing protein
MVTARKRCGRSGILIYKNNLIVVSFVHNYTARLLPILMLVSKSLNKIYRVAFTFLLFFASFNPREAKCQQADSAYLNYLEQFSHFSQTRIMQSSDVNDIVQKFVKNELVSNERFAELSKALYPKQKGIGILLFFYFNDSLRRVFFEPGRVIEEKKIRIGKNELLQLGEDLGIALHLRQQTANRSPHARGGDVDNVSKATVNLDTIIRKLSSLLLPAAFSSRYSHLIVIPALNIATIPFQLLQPYGDSTYLIERCHVTIAPTLVDFVAMRSDVLRVLGSELSLITDFDDAVAGKQIIAPANVKWTTEKSVLVANPAYPTDSPFVYPNLPGADREIDSALQFAEHAVLFRGSKAIKSDILQAMNGADLVYFATHGVPGKTFANDDSYLVLSGADPYLRTYEIMGLRMRKDYKIPDLIILSACQTGVGAAVEAGVAGSLARGFIIGGSHHVVMSLWNVDDEATAYLMNRFLYYLKSTRSFNPSENLRLAALDAKKRYPQPIYWAGFSFFGVDYD